MSPKRGDRAAPPPVGAEYDLRSLVTREKPTEVRQSAPQPTQANWAL